MTSPIAPTADRSRPRRAGAAALAAIVGILALAAPGARADQTVFFDDAGDAPSISLIGDSTLTGVRWYDDYGPLRQYNFVFSAESCRRTIEQSCVSREGYRSQNVIGAMQSLDGELGEVVVVMSGYNDPEWTIDEAIAEVLGEARGQGVEHVVWLSLRTGPDVDYSDPQEQSNVATFDEYNTQLWAVAAESDGFLQIADWATYSKGAGAWFEADGVHLTAEGVDALTAYIADRVEQVLAGEDISPASAPWVNLVPGAEGDTVRATQDALIAAGIALPGGADGVYGNDTMVSVAAYQRDHGGLQVTGAVDLDTARALGVYVDPEAEPPATVAASSPMPTSAVADPGPAPGRSTAAPALAIEAEERPGPAVQPWLVVAGAVIAVAGMVAARRAYVVAHRSARRWARVHPSTSPRRSVADLRRAGELPAVAARVYDHELEQSEPAAWSESVSPP